MIFRKLNSDGARRLKIMPLIDEILELAEKDLDITDILRYIVTANPSLRSELQIPSNLNDDDTSYDKDEVAKFIVSLFNVWIGGLTGQLCLKVDTSYWSTNLQKYISGFTEHHQFPGIIKPYPEAFSEALYKNIRKARQKNILPFADNDNTINKVLYESIERAVRNKKDFADVNAVIKSDSIRIIKAELLNTFKHFTIALNKAIQSLYEYIDTVSSGQRNEAVQLPVQKVQLKQDNAPSTFSSFLNCFGSRHKGTTYSKLPSDPNANICINSDPENDYVSAEKPDFLTALTNYKNQRATENQFLFWGGLFCCITDQFSMKDKIRAVDHLIYWTKRQAGTLNPKEINDANHRFTVRDIAAIRDHRLGVIAREYDDNLPAEFKDAEQRVKNNNSQKNQARELCTKSSPRRK